MHDLKSFHNYLLAMIPFSKNGMLTIINDRSMFFTDFVMGTLSPFIIQYLLWSNIFSQQSESINGFTLNDMMYYYGFALVISRLNNGYDLIQTFSRHVQNGELEVYITKPYGYLSQRLFTFFGESILYLLPLFIVFLIKFITDYPVEKGLSVFIISVLMIISVIVLSQLLCFFLSFSIAIMSFWVIEYNILLSFIILSSSLFGGVLLPPSFWPDWILPLMKYNPFRFIISAPAEFFVKMNSSLFKEIIIGGICYLLFFYAFIHSMWKKGIKNYNGAGG
ncbi:ABC-2 family transporter protein [Photorhabdus heterorhabditis]|uniref:ABC-2 family transporter protein n=1 Tax=Photorhabdus heterorhabditis TaxID=880156 RepID=UPI0030DA7F0F